jgi:hypothetical protein
MYTPPPQDFRQVEQATREKLARAERTAARDAQLGVPRRTLTQKIRGLYRRLTGRKQPEL